CRKEDLLGEVESTFLDKLDANPMLLGFENGIYDLKTHTFRAGLPEDYVTMSVGFDYMPNLMDDSETRRDVDTFFEQVFPDADVRRYVLLYLSSTLEGYNKEHRFHFAHGSSGRNGKGVLMKIMEHTLGKYAVSVNSALICGKSGEANAATPQLTMMVKKRFAYMSEVQDGARINEELFKRLCGGDRLQMRKLYEEMREVDNTAKMLMCCNDMPKIDGSKQANAPRIVIIPFVSRFKEGECDQELHEFPVDRSLETRVGGWNHTMMGVLLQYHMQYSRNGLGQLPEVMRRIKADYLGANDPNSLIDQYVKERLVNRGEGITIHNLLADYHAWEKEIGVTHPQSSKTRALTLQFDKLLMSEDKLRKMDGPERASNIRRFGKGRMPGYAGWTLCVNRVTSLARTLATEIGACSTWKVENRLDTHPGVIPIGWTACQASNILAGEVAEALVKQYLCDNWGDDWRAMILNGNNVTLQTKQEIAGYFGDRQAAVRDTVLQIKAMTGVAKWVAPTENFRMETHEHGVVTGRADFYGRRDRVMYIVETKFSSSDVTNEHCWQMQLYSRWGISQPGVDQCFMVFYNVRSGVLEMGSFLTGVSA
ncbi:hypothetical protein HDU93_000779, partial [Gonapodya sp. JEL0774]